MKTRIVCISDLHGNLIDIPVKCDLVLLTGDIVPLDIQRDFCKSFDWWCRVFVPWKEWLESKGIKCLITFGNHDFFGAAYQWNANLDGVLIDKQVEFKGLKIYGTPYQQYFHNWAFNLHDPELKEKYDLIPEDTNILLVHNPPYGILDIVEGVYGGVERRVCAGSHILNDRLKYLKKLKLCVFGHLHFMGGQSELVDNCMFVNAAICNEAYIPANQPVVIDL